MNLHKYVVHNRILLPLLRRTACVIFDELAKSEPMEFF
jgi:hypothetical protein